MLNITLPNNFEELEDKNAFYKTWISLNRHNIDIKVVQNNIVAFEKGTDNIVATAKVDEEESYYFKILTNDFEPRDFDMKFTANIGQEVFVAMPEIDYNDKFDRSPMKFKKENIYKAIVTGIGGANDLLCTISHKVLATNERSSVVQEAVFVNYDDAVGACEAIPESGVNTWDEYIELAKEFIKYRYKLIVPIKMGQELYINSEYSRIPVLKDKLTNGEYFAKTKVSRLIMTVIHGEIDNIHVQTTGNLYYDELYKFADTSDNKEVIVTKDGLVYNSIYNNKKVVELALGLKLDMSECHFEEV